MRVALDFEDTGRVFKFQFEMGQIRLLDAVARFERDGGEGAMQNAKPVAMDMTVGRNAVFRSRAKFGRMRGRWGALGCV